MAKTTRPPRETVTKAEPTDKLYMETTLLRVAGALFSHDQKRAASRTEPIELNKGLDDKHIHIRPDPKLGQPGPLAHKVFIALMKKYSDYGTPIQNEVSFTQRELARLIGRSDFGGKDSEALSRALHEIHYTFVRASFKRADGKHIQDSFNIFSRLLFERREFPSDPIQACTITIADPIVASLKDDHFTCLNHFLMQRLGTIGQAFYMRLFFHFANLYETHKNRRTLLVSKQYEDLCAEWLGGLDLRQHKSLIMQQLGSHLDQLKGAQFLASYSIEKATTRPGFVITFKPGPAFFVDYDRYYRGKMQGNLQFQYHGDRQDHHEPMRVASLFVAKRSGVAPETVASVVTSDVEIAREMIAELGYINMDKFISYSLRQAKKTHFDVQRLAGLRQYVASFKELEAKAVAKAASQTLGRKNDAIKAERDAYESWCAAQTRKHVAALPNSVRADAEALERNRQSATPGPMQPTMIKMGTEIQLRKIANERHPLPNFETWKSSRRQ